jgi:hypothetical protein
MLLGAEGFLVRHPWVWLIWEPGRWTPSTSVELAATAETLPATADERAGPRTDDGLCFELNPGLSHVTVGRSPECEVSADDATLSRVAFELAFRDGGWWLRSLTGRPVLVDGVPAQAPTPVPSSRITTGEVVFTTLGPRAMAERIARRRLSASLH